MLFSLTWHRHKILPSLKTIISPTQINDSTAVRLNENSDIVVVEKNDDLSSDNTTRVSVVIVDMSTFTEPGNNKFTANKTNFYDDNTFEAQLSIHWSKHNNLHKINYITSQNAPDLPVNIKKISSHTQRNNKNPWRAKKAKNKSRSLPFAPVNKYYRKQPGIIESPNILSMSSISRNLPASYGNLFGSGNNYNQAPFPNRRQRNQHIL